MHVARAHRDATVSRHSGERPGVAPRTSQPRQARVANIIKHEWFYARGRIFRGLAKEFSEARKRAETLAAGARNLSLGTKHER